MCGSRLLLCNITVAHQSSQPALDRQTQSAAHARGVSTILSHLAKKLTRLSREKKCYNVLKLKGVWHCSRFFYVKIV